MGRIKDKISATRVKKTLEKLGQTHQGIAFNISASEVDNDGLEMDSVLITKRCIYIININNYQGSIFGEFDEPAWYQTTKYRNNNNNGKETNVKSQI